MNISNMLTPELLDGLPDHSRLWLALSGGLDSVVLLDLAVQHCAAQQKTLDVIHVHHGLSPNADQWADHCRALCHRYQELWSVSISCQVVKVQLEAASSIEEQARKARYQAFEEYVSDGDLILMAHHGNDQLETMLMRLMRGAGAQGLSGMPVERPLGLGHLYRPLLAFQRAELEVYAQDKGLVWVEDESNRSHEFDRNFLRHEITPHLIARWPNAVRVACRSAQVLADADTLNKDLADIDLKGVACSPGVLSCSALLQLSPERQRNLLRFWLQSAGVRSPDFRQITIIIEELVLAQDDAQPLFRRPSYELRRYRDRLFLTLFAADQQEKNRLTKEGRKKNDSVDLAKAPAVRRPVAMGTGISCLRMGDVAESLEQGLGEKGCFFRIQLITDSEPVTGSEILSLPLSSMLSLAHRKGGESLRLPNRGRKTLKKLLQERGVPAWLRGQVRLFWLETHSGESRLIGAWSPLVEEKGAGSEFYDCCHAGIFWWDISVLEVGAGSDSQRVVITRK